MSDDVTEALFEELSSLDAESAMSIVTRWLANNNLMRSSDALKAEAGDDPAKWAAEAAAANPNSAPASKTDKPEQPPVGEALPVPGTSTRPGRLFDAEALDPASVPEILLTKPDPVFFGERDDKRREQSATEEFPLMARATPAATARPHPRTSASHVHHSF